MIRAFLKVAAVLLFVLLLISVVYYMKFRPDTDTRFGNLKELVSAVQKADNVVLYEGLPHPGHTPGLLDKELKSKRTVQIHGFPFYEESLQLKEADAKRLSELYCDPQSFKRFSGEKKCGGFHPDFCIEWHMGTTEYHVLICLGCYEIKSFGPKVELYCDVTDDARKQFKAVLTTYYKNRPKAGRPDD